ncbi:hypothetical protein, partial [Escherichia coli]|uniref:hypothetical protein n=1 Tax=Escherichia coli TaxID=562 RepID=UPI001C708C8E
TVYFYSIFHGSVSVTLVGSLCFCAKAVGRGSLVTSKHERMAGKVLPTPTSRPFSQQETAITGSV